MNRHHTKKPTDNHKPCKTRNCNNYFNKVYKSANGYCRYCNIKGKMDKDIKTNIGCEICGEHIKSKKRKDEINVCDKCNEKHPIRK